MEKHSLYIPPVAEVILLQGQEQLLQMSNWGNAGEPGNNFDPDDILDNGLFNSWLSL